MHELLERQPHATLAAATSGARRAVRRLLLAALLVAAAAGVAWLLHEQLGDGGPAWLARGVHVVEGWLRAAWTVHG